MDINLRTNSSRSHKQTCVVFHILCGTSSLFLGFAFAIINSFYWTDFYLSHDQRIQATHRSFCGDNKKNNYSWIEFGLLPSWNKHWTSFVHHYCFYSNSLWIFGFHKKTTWTCTSNLEFDRKYSHFIDDINGWASLKQRLNSNKKVIICLIKQFIWLRGKTRLISDNQILIRFLTNYNASFFCIYFFKFHLRTSYLIFGFFFRVIINENCNKKICDKYHSISMGK